jgi:hypothetical protein
MNGQSGDVAVWIYLCAGHILQQENMLQMIHEGRICNHHEGCNSNCRRWLEVEVQLILFWIVGLYGLKFKGFM